MENTLEITKENALLAFNSADKKGKTILENLLGKKVFQKNIMERINSFDDILEELGIAKELFDGSCAGLEPDEVAYKKAKLVCKALNEGWVPDWTNGQWDKYFPWFTMGSSSGVGFAYYDYVYWRTHSFVGSRLCFKSSELAEFAGKLFEQEIYKPLFILEN